MLSRQCAPMALSRAVELLGEAEAELWVVAESESVIDQEQRDQLESVANELNILAITIRGLQGDLRRLTREEDPVFQLDEPPVGARCAGACRR